MATCTAPVPSPHLQHHHRLEHPHPPSSPLPTKDMNIDFSQQDSYKVEVKGQKSDLDKFTGGSHLEHSQLQLQVPHPPVVCHHLGPHTRIRVLGQRRQQPRGGCASQVDRQGGWVLQDCRVGRVVQHAAGFEAGLRWGTSESRHGGWGSRNEQHVRTQYMHRVNIGLPQYSHMIMPPCACTCKPVVVCKCAAHKACYSCQVKHMHTNKQVLSISYIFP